MRIYVKDPDRKGWLEIENGPFPITSEQLAKARAMYAAEVATCSPLQGARHAPQTAARAILKQVAPALSDFDCLMLGFAVTSSKIRTES